MQLLCIDCMVNSCRGNASEDAGEEALMERAVEHFSQMLFLERLRTMQDRQHLMELYQHCWGHPLPLTPTPELTISPTCLKLGWATLPRTHSHAGSSQPALEAGESVCFVKEGLLAGIQLCCSLHLVSKN